MRAHTEQERRDCTTGGQAQRDAASRWSTAFSTIEKDQSSGNSIQPSISPRHLTVDMRLLATRPAFAALVIGTLALGIGANSAMFSLVRAVLLRPLGYEDPDRLVKIVGFDKRTSLDANLSPADFMDFARDARSFERLGAHGWVGFFTIGGQEPERLGGVNVTEGFFPALGVQPARGRVFLPAEDVPGAAQTAILSD